MLTGGPARGVALGRSGRAAARASELASVGSLVGWVLAVDAAYGRTSSTDVVDGAAASSAHFNIQRNLKGAGKPVRTHGTQ